MTCIANLSSDEVFTPPAAKRNGCGVLLVDVLNEAIRRAKEWVENGRRYFHSK